MNEYNLDITRQFFYSFFSLCFIPWKIDENKESFLKMLEVIKQSNLNDTVADSTKMLLSLQENQNMLAKEYDMIFADPFKSSAGISASYYFEGYEAGKMLERTREILCELGVVKVADFNSPEDHFGFLFDTMSYAINLKVSSKEGDCRVEDLEKKLFVDVINPNIEFLISDIFEREECKAYGYVVSILHAFLGFERNHFGVDAPKEQGLSKLIDLKEHYKKKKIYS